MADPLSMLRNFNIAGKEIKEYKDHIIFGDSAWPKTVQTNYQIYSTGEDKSKKEYYTLECVLYFLKNMNVAHPHYVRQGGLNNIPVVMRPDRKNLLAYLKGEHNTSSSIDKDAAIPPLKVSTDELYKNHGSEQPTNSRTTNNKKRPHDPEVEKKVREEFAARLYEPSTKKLATNSESGDTSAASSMLGPEKIAAFRAKHLAVKRTTIIDADTEIGKESELLFAMDLDPAKLIKSKEKVWRTRSSILKSQSKNFLKSVMPLLNVLTKPEDMMKKNQIPPSQNPADVARSYNRYDQERFVKLDIEIDTKKSFVSGVANKTAAAVPSPRTSITPQKPMKRVSTVPIIIIPATTTSLINKLNATAILQDLTYNDGSQNKSRDSEIIIQRKKPDGGTALYKVLDNPIKLDADDWKRVVAVFVQGPAWQFKGWPWGGSPVEIFSRIKGFHLKWDESKLDDNVARWNVHILELSRNKRHLDKANLLKFWSSLDAFMMKYKSFLKF